jgi:hypothetical protein
MTTFPPRGSIDAARSQWIEAEEGVLNAMSALAELDVQIAAARLDDRPSAEDLAGLLKARDAVLASLVQARAAERAARDALHKATAASVPASGAGFVPLDAQTPIVFLPLRLESRFERRPPNVPSTWRPSLMVRIYPDDIAVETHEPPLTWAEFLAGEEYWKQALADGHEREAWRRIVMSYPPERAAWIVRLRQSGAGGNFSDLGRIRPATWSRPARSRVLPDFFVARAYIGFNLVQEVVGKAIPDPLIVSVDPYADPSLASEVFDISGGRGLDVERDIAWMLDFNAAEQAGMAIRIPPQPPTATGYDELFVIGVKGSLPPAEASRRIEELFEGHHYARGFGFARLGTPTKNTSESRSPHPAPDPGGTHSFPIERGLPLNAAEGNGTAFTRALGIAPAVTEHIEHASLTEQANARAMTAALWPATLGYFLRQMLDPLFSPAEVEEIREHVVSYVHGRGPLPAIRVGNIPYGVVPVTALSKWRVTDKSPLWLRLGNELNKVLPQWRTATSLTPRLYRTADAELDLLQALAMDGRSRRVLVRPALGPSAQWNLLNFLGQPTAPWVNARNAAAAAAFNAIGRPQWNPLLGWMSFDLVADRFANELVAKQPSETGKLPFDFIQWLRTASIADIRAQTLPAGVARPESLLYIVLRHAVLHEFLRLADILIGTPRVPEPESMIFGGRGLVLDSPWSRLFGIGLFALGGLTPAQFLRSPAADSHPTATPAWYLTSLKILETLPTAELERLFTETLDVCSHRIDAWVTSLATRTLAMQRDGRRGSWLAAYGWLEKITPSATPATQTLPDGRIAKVQTSGGGHVHAPGMTHAAAGAALRNASLTRGTPLDLSSDRVRRAMLVLDAIRTGEMPGSVLGAMFERGLRERGLQPDLQSAIDTLRNLFPLVANKLVDSGDGADDVTARGVADGLHLYEAFRDATFVPASLSFTATTKANIAAELAVLGDTVDAMTELLTAESVFQSMRNNHVAAAAALETMSRGTRPPELEIVKQPRGGTTMTHRFAVLLGEGQTAAPGWAAPASPRSTASPQLDSWIGKLLGTPNNAFWTVRIADPQPNNPNQVITKNVTLNQLALRPIDFLALAQAGSDGGTTELELRVAAAAQAPLGALVTIEHAPHANRVNRTLADLIETAAAVRDLIHGARPLMPDHLLVADVGGAKRPVDPAADTRAKTAHAALQGTRTLLVNTIAAFRSGGDTADPAPLRAACVRASQFNVDGAYAASRVTKREELLERAELVVAELSRRDAEALTKTDPRELAQAVFGRDFLFLPEFAPPQPAELAQAIAHAPALVGNDNLAARRWLQSATPVRPALQRWRSMSMRTAPFASAAPAPSLAVVQLPFVAGASWVALPFANESLRPPSGRVSIVLHRVATPAPAAKWAGLLIDEWSEVIPAAVEQTSVSLAYETPRAEAPRAVLIGVLPPGAETATPTGPRALWTFDLMFDVIRETLLLARIRAVDLHTLGPLGQLLPALSLATNPKGNSISTEIQSMLVKE